MKRVWLLTAREPTGICRLYYFTTIVEALLYRVTLDYEKSDTLYTLKTFD